MYIVDMYIVRPLNQGLINEVISPFVYEYSNIKLLFIPLVYLYIQCKVYTTPGNSTD